MLAGYFSYDIIRYIEKIPDTCLDDLKLPDSRIMRPRILIIHDNLKKKIYFIYNCYLDEKIKDYSLKYNEIINELEYNIFLSQLSNKAKKNHNNKKLIIKSNISKNKFLNNVKKAKKYIKLGDIFQVVLSQRFEAKLTKEPCRHLQKAS